MKQQASHNDLDEGELERFPKGKARFSDHDCDEDNKPAPSAESGAVKIALMQQHKQEKPFRWAKYFPFLRSQADRQDHNIEAREKTQESASGQREMVANIALLHESRVGDVMIPRSEIEALEINTSLAETLILFEKSDHSRMPVYHETLDDPRGMVHIRDLLSFITKTARGATVKKDAQKQHDGQAIHLDFSHVDLSKTIGEIDVMREVLFVPASMRASQLLSRMQTTRTQMALVIDEYGGTDGLASMEDVFEVVVGDIEDEHDDDDVMIVAEDAGCWLVDARAELEDIAENLGDAIDWGELGEDVDTIGGLIVAKLDHIPARGEMVELNGYCFQVLEADRRRIRRVRIKRL